jgi:hypothetical protein
LPRLDLVLESAHVSVALDCDHAALLGVRQLEPLAGMPSSFQTPRPKVYFLPRLDLILGSGHVSAASDHDRVILLGARQQGDHAVAPLRDIGMTYEYVFLG